MENKIPENIHQGHRGRMRNKLKRHGGEVFETYELLEMLLYHLIPYKDTNPIAKQLMFYFGSVDAVLSAEVEELTKIKGVGRRTAEFIHAVGKAGLLADDGSDSGVNGVGFTNYEQLKKFFIDYFSDKTEKEIVVLLLDNSMHALCFEKVYSIDYDSGAVKAKPFIDLALRNRAAAAVIAHNHFAPLSRPSLGDSVTNRMIENSLKSVGVSLIEHYVVSGKQCFGIMKIISNEFADGPLTVQ